MADKKKPAKAPAKTKKVKAPSLNERITDFSTGNMGKVTWVPKKKK